VQEFGRGVDGCIHHQLPPQRKAAYTSAAYNIGVDAFCRSSMARKENAGDVQGACDALLLYVYAKGVKLPGLVKRREQERELCLAA
jgi:lysozyme